MRDKEKVKAVSDWSKSSGKRQVEIINRRMPTPAVFLKKVN
jgi:hypothetical protein